MRLLLHMCCGPCSCYPVKKLREEGIEPVGWFFNPNIHPYKEWEQRLETAKCVTPGGWERRLGTRQKTALRRLPRRYFTAFTSGTI